MEAELHPVELCEHVVRQVEPSVPEDVDLDAAKHAERGEASLASWISSPCRRSASASRPGTTRTFGVWSQIARYS